jgi:alpha-galactosidase
MEPLRLLFLGNSITWHPPAPEVFWEGDWGMAASCREADYVHRLAALLTARTGQPPVTRVENIAAFERAYATWQDPPRQQEWQRFAPDWIVLAIGENVPSLAPVVERRRFCRHLRQLLVPLLAAAPGQLLVRSCFWPEPLRDRLLRRVCTQLRGRFVDLAPLSQDAACRAETERPYAHSGVGAHPGDAGMQAIAERLLAAWPETGAALT